jgi:hypothetical protein
MRTAKFKRFDRLVVVANQQGVVRLIAHLLRGSE